MSTHYYLHLYQHTTSISFFSAHCSSSMFSFLSSTFVVSKIGTPKPTLLSRPTTWRFFSQSHARYAEPEDPEARRKRLDRKNEQRRQKYHSDPVFREKEITRQTLRFNNPLYRDEEKRKMRLRRQDWCNHNPKGYAVSIERSTLYITQRRASDPRFKFSSQLHHFLMRTTLAREELPWKTHVPTVYPEKVTRECARCDRRPPGGGAKLWYVCGAIKPRCDGVAHATGWKELLQCCPQ
jgi:hypothetical protein